MINIFKKIKGFFKLEKKDSRTAPLLSTGGGGAIWSNKNYETFSKEAYLKNVISFRCIDMIAKSVSSTPWDIFNKDSKGRRKKIEGHPLRQVFKRPNPFESFNQIALKAVAFYCIAGNSYIEKVVPVSTRTDTGSQGTPKELYVLRPDRINLIQDEGSGLISGYKYTGTNGKSATFKRDLVTGACDILHLRGFNPLDDFYGGSTSESSGYEIDTYNEMTNWNKSLLQNMARPGMIFQVTGNLTDTQFESLEKQLNENYSGSNKTGKNLILESEKGTTAVPYGWSPKELDYVEGGRELARRICLAYGVPPMLLGIPGDNTYSNYQEARLAFWEETIFFYLQLLGGELNNWLFGASEENVFLEPILDDVPALAPRRDALWQRANTATFITTNEKREMVGLDDIGPEGDTILISPMLVPLGEETNTDEVSNPEPEEDYAETGTPNTEEVEEDNG